MACALVRLLFRKFIIIDNFHPLIKKSPFNFKLFKRETNVRIIYIIFDLAQ